MQYSVRKRKREYINLNCKLTTHASSRKEDKEAQRITNQDQHIKSNKLDETIEHPKWKAALTTKDAELEKHLKEFEAKRMNNCLWMTRHDTKIIELNTKIVTMFTPLEDTFVYKNMMIKIEDLKLADKFAATTLSSV